MWLQNMLLREISSVVNFDWYGPVIVIKWRGRHVYDMTHDDITLAQDLTLKSVCLQEPNSRTHLMQGFDNEILRMNNARNYNAYMHAESRSSTSYYVEM